jgi:integrase/recombinase XerD
MLNCPGSNTKYLTISDCFNNFITIKKSIGLSNRTLETYQIHIAEFIKFTGDIELCKISKQHYYKFILTLQDRGVKGVTIASYCRSIRAFLYWNMSEGYIKKFKIKIPKYQKTIKETYTDKELSVLLKKPDINNCTFTEYKIWVLENILIATGLRISSLLNLRIKDVDLSDNSFIINTTKNKTPMKTYYNNILSNIIKEYLKFRGGEPEDYFICTNEGEQFKLRSCQCAVKRYNNSRGVNKTSIHLFRHTFAKNAILAGMDVFTLMNMLQHSNIETTQNYVKLFNADIKKSCELYNPQKLYNVSRKHNKIKFHN